MRHRWIALIFAHASPILNFNRIQCAHAPHFTYATRAKTISIFISRLPNILKQTGFGRAFVVWPLLLTFAAVGFFVSFGNTISLGDMKLAKVDEDCYKINPIWTKRQRQRTEAVFNVRLMAFAIAVIRETRDLVVIARLIIITEQLFNAKRSICIILFIAELCMKFDDKCDCNHFSYHESDEQKITWSHSNMCLALIISSLRKKEYTSSYQLNHYRIKETESIVRSLVSCI